MSYLPAILWGDFIWDDLPMIDTLAVREAGGLRQIWLSPAEIKAEGHYWPLVYTVFWLQHKLWGFSPAGFHLVNVLLHVANTVLVWHLMRRLKVPGAWLVAAVFAVHPVHVESVAWVIELKDVLSGLLYLSALLAWIRFAGEPRAGRYLTSLALYVARRPACSDAAAGSAAPARTARRAGRQGKPACGRDATVQGCCRTAIRPTGSALGTCGVPVSTALSMTLDRSRAPTPGTSPAGKRA